MKFKLGIVLFCTSLLSQVSFAQASELFESSGLNPYETINNWVEESTSIRFGDFSGRAYEGRCFMRDGKIVRTGKGNALYFGQGGQHEDYGPGFKGLLDGRVALLEASHDMLKRKSTEDIFSLSLRFWDTFEMVNEPHESPVYRQEGLMGEIKAYGEYFVTRVKLRNETSCLGYWQEGEDEEKGYLSEYGRRMGCTKKNGVLPKGTQFNVCYYFRQFPSKEKTEPVDQVPEEKSVPSQPDLIDPMDRFED